MGTDRRRTAAAAALTCLCALPAAVGTAHASERDHDEHHTQHEAHAHGRGTLGVVLDGDVLALELRIPAVNAVGFEYAPRTDAEREAVRDALAALGGGGPFVPTAAASCEVESSQADLAGTSHGGDGHDDDHATHDHDEKHGHDEEHAHAGEEAHSELHVAVHFRCARPARLEALDVGRLFAVLRDVEAIDAQVVTPDTQRAVALSPGRTTVVLRP